MKANEVVAYLDSMQVDKVRVMGEEVIACCPMHGERRPSFGVSLVKEGLPYNCFACHASGLLPRIAMELKGMTWKEAFAYVNRFGNYDITDGCLQSEVVMFEERFGDDDVGISRDTLDMFNPINLKAKSYLRKRSVSREVYVNAGIKIITKRLVIPWYIGHQLLGYTTRSYHYSKDNLRGCSLFNFKKHQYLYDPAGARSLANHKRVYVTEGEFDALRGKSCGYEMRAIAGTLPTQAQADALCKQADQVVLVFDNDKDGENATEIMHRLIAGRVMVLKPTVLPDAYSDLGASDDTLINTVLNEDNLEICF